MDTYQDFLASKVVAARPSGFDVAEADIDAKLFPFQRAIVRWAIRLGRCAIFADCGLGKTYMQLEWARHVFRRANRPVLILTPLAVGPQTVAEADKLGILADLCESQDGCDGASICVTNYHKLHKFDPAAFAGVVLDESSILKNYMGKTKRALIDAFREAPYKLCCTATPAPNDHMELGNHAEFLGAMDSNEMLSRWFINDQGKTGTYRLKGHAAADYWRWVASWAVCLSRPSDLGFPDEGFDLPPLEVYQHVVRVDATVGASEQGKLFRDDSLTATSMHKEMRLTAADRAAKVAELVSGTPGPWCVWCNTNYEADALMGLIPDAVEVRGDDSDDDKADRMTGFAEGRYRVMVSKPSLAGFGLNWQHCNRVAFVGLSYSHEQFYQAIRRSWRFGQTRPVQCHVVIAETEGEVLGAIKRKEHDRQVMMREMIEATRRHGLGAECNRLELTAAASDTAGGKSWTMHLGDCCENVKGIKDDAIDFTIFSPPFSTLYIYSDALADMGNSADDAEFFRHFGYLVPELFRVTVPGRLCAVHCKDLPKYCVRDGVAGLKDFPGETIRLFESAGWTFHSRVTIWKCPVTERERTNAHGLLHKTLKRDSSAVRQGMADYLLVFRKPTTDGGLLSAKPVARPDVFREDEATGEKILVKHGGLDGYEGCSDPRMDSSHPSPFARRPSADPALAVWQRYAEPVWWDVDQMDVLNVKQARGGQDEKHICPLQLGVIRRAVHLWTNPGDLVLSPFAGIGSEGVGAIALGRRFVGCELKREYFQAACRNLAAAEREANQPSLFDGIGDEPLAEAA